MIGEPAPTAATSASLRRRRRLTVVLVAGLLTVGVAGVLVDRSLGGELLSGDRWVSRFPGDRVEDPFEEGEVVEVVYRHDAGYDFDFTLTNESRWPVRVLGFPRFDSLLRQANVAVDTTPFDGPTQDFAPFRPFTLGASGSAAVRVRTHFANCDHYGPGSSATITAVPVRLRALWATHTRFVDLPTGIQIPAPPAGGCPAP